MKRYLAAALLLAWAGFAIADGCVTRPIMIDGVIIYCQTCCWGGTCSTTCF